jgi:hypothetical protein
MTDTTAQHIAARDDVDLTERLIATAEQLAVTDAASFVRSNLGRLISVDIGEGTTVTSVHAYAKASYEAALAALPPRPGVNPAAVTDVQLIQAVQAVWNPTT